MSDKKPKTRNGPETAQQAGGPMDVDLLQQIVKLMAANDLNTVDVRDGERRIILKRGAVQAAPIAHAAPVAPIHHAPPAAAASHKPSGPGGAEEESGLLPIKSPMVGTFYSKPNPESKPFVILGSPVTEDTDVCVIEAMKTFNNIQAGCRGTIARILCQDGEPVDFGKTLFLVKP